MDRPSLRSASTWLGRALRVGEILHVAIVVAEASRAAIVVAEAVALGALDSVRSGPPAEPRASSSKRRMP